MSESNGTNGNGEKMRAAAVAVVENMALTALARISMVVWPLIGTIVLSVGAWFLSGISADLKTITLYIADDKAITAAHVEKLKGLERRTTNLEGRVFGFSPPPQPNP